MDIQKIQVFFSPYRESDDKDFGYKILFIFAYIVLVFIGSGIFGDDIGFGTHEALIVYKGTSFVIVGIFSLQRLRYLKASYWWLIPAFIGDIGTHITYMLILYIAGNAYIKDSLEYINMVLATGRSTIVPHKSFKDWRATKQSGILQEIGAQGSKLEGSTTQVSATCKVRPKVSYESYPSFIPSIDAGAYIFLLIILFLSIFPVGFISLAIMSGAAHGGGGENIIAGILIFYFICFPVLILGRLKSSRKPLHLGLILFIPIFPFVQIGFLLYLCFV